MTDYPDKSRDGQNERAFSSQATSGTGTGSDRQGASFSDLQQKATQDFSEIKDAAMAQASQALDKSAEMAAEKKNVVADQLAGVAEALVKVGDEMKGGDYGMVARYARDLGNSAERLARDLKNRDMSEVVSLAESFGRRQPVAFLGIAAIAGLAASRFVTASARRTGTQSSAGRPLGRGEGAETSANPMAGRLKPHKTGEATGTGATASATPQAGQSTTGQSSQGLASSGQSSQGQSAQGQSSHGQSASGQPGSGRTAGENRPIAPSSWQSESRPVTGGEGASSARPAGSGEGTGIGGSGLGTSPNRPSSSTDTPTLSPSAPSAYPPGRVSISGSGSTSSDNPGTPGQTYNSINSSNEGRSNV